MTLRLFTSLAISLLGASVALGGQTQPQPAPQPPPKAPAPTTVIPREGCVTAECHPGVKSRPFLHGPLNANMCDSCHTSKDPEKHTFEYIRARDQMCAICHVVEVPAGSVTHKPFSEGECLSCHDPHASKEPAMLRGDRYADACKTCHEDVTGAHDLIHGPAAAGACGACHEPHAAKYPKLLSAEGRDLCLRCHVSTGARIKSARVVHEPVLGDCRVCHNPHATDNRAMLNSAPVVLCTACHQEIGKKMDVATTQHAAVTTERECLNCHAAHASDHSRLLKNDVKDLCFECHNKTIKLTDGTRLANIKQVIEKGKSLHGAISQESCVVCHEIHGGGHRRLLTNEYPSDGYYPFKESAYSLCFSCHDKQLVLLARTDEATGFRNGNRNLHYSHVNKEEKGRSCGICHDSHAANSANHIRDSFPFGPKKWLLPIKYEQLENGGRCGAGCHAPLEYNRVDPIIYPATPPGGAWKGDDLVPLGEAQPPKEPAEPPKK